MHRARLFPLVVLIVCFVAGLAASQQKGKPKAPAVSPVDARLEKLKTDAAAEIDNLKDVTQQMVDQLFSFGEPGFQEFETQKYCADILTRNGFRHMGFRQAGDRHWIGR